MISNDSISFDDTGLSYLGEKNGGRIWFTEAGDGIILYYFTKRPDIYADIHSLDAIRAFHQNTVYSDGSGLIEVETPTVDGCIALHSILKVPQEPTGMTYLGSLILPFRDFSFLIKIQSPERGVTGIRDSIIFDEMLGAGEVEISDEGKITGWMQDPYDATITAPLMRNRSEDEQYDAQFPDHPLSRLRVLLRRMEESVRVTPEVKDSPPFVFAEQQEKKPWWRFW